MDNVSENKKNPQAKILVLDEANLGFRQATTLIDLTYVESGGKQLSLARKLADEFGDDCIACVTTLDTNDRFDFHTSNEEVEEFCQKHSIITSFGIRIGKTPLADKPFWRENFQNSYAEAWDGLLVFVINDDDDDRERVDRPEPSSGKKLSLEEVVV